MPVAPFTSECAMGYGEGLRLTGLDRRGRRMTSYELRVTMRRLRRYAVRRNGRIKRVCSPDPCPALVHGLRGIGSRILGARGGHRRPDRSLSDAIRAPVVGGRARPYPRDPPLRALRFWPPLCILGERKRWGRRGRCTRCAGLRRSWRWISAATQLSPPRTRYGKSVSIKRSRSGSRRGWGC